MYFLKFSVATIAFVSAASACAEPVQPEGDVIILDEGRTFTDGDRVITVVGAPVSQNQTNASVSFIGEAALREYQNGEVANVLARLPGVSITRNGAPGSFTGVRIRGGDAEHTLVVIDGVRVGDPSSPGGGFDFGQLMIDSVDTIEVLRGTNSVPWGSRALAGVVSVTTIRPRTNINDPTTLAFTSEYGSHDSARVSGQLRAQATPIGALALGGGYAHSDGISSAASGTERDGLEQFSVNASGIHPIASGLELRSFGMMTRSRVDLDGFAPPTFAFGDTAEYQKSAEHYAAATLVHHIGSVSADDPEFSQQIQYSIADINRDNYDPASGSGPSFAARGRNQRLAYAFDWAPLGSIGGGWLIHDLRFVGGIEREWERALTADGFSSDDGRTAMTSGYAQMIARPSDALSLTAGVRHDDHRDFGGATSFAADAGYAVGNAVRLRASYREGFRAPTLFQLSDNASAFGNPDLRAERARAYEIGVTFAPVQGWQFDVALFRRDSRNLIDFVSCSGAGAPAICPTGNRPFGTYANINRARAEGVEAELAVRATDALSLTLNTTYQKATDRTPGSALLGNDLARRPQILANVEVNWQPSGDQQPSLGLSLRYAGASYDNRANSVRLDDYALIDARVAYPITEALDLFARIENLFDAQYETVDGYGNAGRSAYVGIRWSY